VNRAGGPPLWLNEYHADFLVYDRLEAARRAAARRRLIDDLRRDRAPARRRVTAILAGLSRRVRALL
jgi:hypothetical protein